MSGTVLRAILALVFAFHGVGHAMGVIPALRIINLEGTDQGWLRQWSSRSWLLTDPLGDGASRLLCAALYLLALVGFVAAALAVAGWLLPHDWWRPLAIVSSVLSLVALALYWNALIFLFPHKVGALAVNITTLVCLLALNWPSEADLGL
jgi:hypothetical protein